jgi:uncharacterized membrane protein required for colicin V production
MRKGIVAFSGMIVGLVLLIVTFIWPWYTMNATGSLGVNYNVDFYLTKMEAKGSINNQYFSLSIGYAEAKENAQSVGVNTESCTVIETAKYLTFVAMVTALIAVIGIAAFVFRLGTLRIMKYIGGGFGFLTGLLALISALYVMNTKFAENMSGFWFNQSVLGVTVTGGPGYAWYLMIVVATITVISAVAILLKKIIPEDASVEKIVPPVHE